MADTPIASTLLGRLKAEAALVERTFVTAAHSVNEVAKEGLKKLFPDEIEEKLWPKPSSAVAVPARDPVNAAISEVNPSFAPTNGEAPLTVDGVPGTYNIEPVAGGPNCTRISRTPTGKPTKVIAPMVCG